MNRRAFLKTAAGALFLPAARAASRPPNIVIIYADDLGYGDVGCYGSGIATPNLDRMAAEGMRFTDFYAGSAVCSPSRAALLTGRYPVRCGVPNVLAPNQAGLPDGETTIAQSLKKLDYRTMCVGKWHLGDRPGYLPTCRGFDGYFGIPYSNDMTPRPLMHNEDILEPQVKLDTLTARYTQQATNFIENGGDAPFFLYMPHTSPHIPLAASPRFRGHSPLGLYGDVVEELDWSVGQVLDSVKRSGCEDNTLVLFSSDNGPWYNGSPGRLRGRKGQTYEGGMRVPAIARWPGRVPQGNVCRGWASVLDLMPTVANLCGAPLPDKPLDGIDIWPLLSGALPWIEREALLYFDGWNLQCARKNKWKMHFSRYNSPNFVPAPPEGRLNLPLRPPELYDLLADTDESYDVSDEYPDVVQDIQDRVARLLPNLPDTVRQAWADTQAR